MIPSDESAFPRMASLEDPLRVLLIEDSAGDAILAKKIICAALNNEVAIEHVTTLRAALEMLEKNAFDIALLDRSLPDVNAFEGLHSIQNMSPKLPVVFLTGHSDEEAALEAVMQGAQDYLYKDKLDAHVVKRSIQYAILRKQFEGVLVMRANYDFLTGMANRMLFESRLDMALERIKRYESNLALLFIDLDHFKEVNDTHGHAAGDALLKDVAKRLKASLRPYDTAARFGGDEFAVLLDMMPEPSHSYVVAEKIINLLETPFIIEDQVITIGASIGITNIDLSDIVSAREYISQADSAMYRAKAVDGSNAQLYLPEKNSLEKA